MKDRAFLLSLTYSLMDYPVRLSHAVVLITEERLKNLLTLRWVQKHTADTISRDSDFEVTSGGLELEFYNYLPRFVHCGKSGALSGLIDDMQEKFLEVVEIPVSSVEEAARQRTDCTKIHICQEGIYWTTLKKHGEVLFTTETLTWDALVGKLEDF